MFRWPRSLLGGLVLTALLAPPAFPGESAKLGAACLVGPGKRIAPDGSSIVDAASGAVLWTAGEERLAGISCDGGEVVALVDEGRRARLVRLVFSGTGLEPGEETDIRGGAPGHLVAESGRVLVSLERRGRWTLVFLGTGHSRRGTRIAVADEVHGIALGPRRERVFAAVGTSIRSFSWPEGRTGLVFTFDAEVDHLLVSEALSRVYVALGSRLEAVDPDASPTRGRLPPIASRDFPTAIAGLDWTDPGGGTLVVRLAEGPPLPLDPRSLSADSRKSRARLVASSRPEPRPVPSTGSASPEQAEPIPPAGDDPPRQDEPFEGEAPAAAAPPSKAPAAEERQAEEAMPAARADDDLSEAPAGPRESPPPPAVDTDPVPPVSLPVPQDSGPETPAPSDDAGAPVIEAEPSAAANAATEEGSPREGAAEATPPLIRGVLEGRAELVETVVVKGPDSLLKEYERVSPAPPEADGTRRFELDGLPTGRYVVLPMGQGGLSLATRPARAVVEVREGESVVVRFEVLREW